MSFLSGLATAAVSSAASGAAKAGVGAIMGGMRAKRTGGQSGSGGPQLAKATDYVDTTSSYSHAQQSREAMDNSTKKATTNRDREDFLPPVTVTEGEDPYELALMWDEFLRGEKYE